MSDPQGNTGQGGPAERPAQSPDWAFFQAVFQSEDRRLARLRKVAGLSPSPQQRIGVALSGGGIRSATFSLGVIQALAQGRRIANIDYLSTVSGGGYIGSWLSACIYRAREAGSRDPVRAVEEKIAPQNVRREADEPGEVRFLRAYSNYLTPRLGLFSGDTLAAVSGLLRNLSLNLALGMLCILFIIASFHVVVTAPAASMKVEDFGLGTLLALFGSFGAMSFSLLLQRHDARTLAEPARENILTCFRAARIVALVFLSLGLVNGSLWIGFNAKSVGWLPILLVPASASVGMLVGAWLAAFIWRRLRPRQEKTGPETEVSRRSWWKYLLIWQLPQHEPELASLLSSIFLFSGSEIKVSRREWWQYPAAVVICSAMTWLLATVGAEALRLSLSNTSNLIHVVALGPAVGVVVLWLMFVLWIGFVGNTYSEFTREWLSRFLGEMSGLAAFWMVTGGLIVYARPVWHWAATNSVSLVRPYLSLSTSGAALAVAFVGLGWLLWRRQRTPHAARPEPETKRTGLMVLCLLLVCVFVFAITVSFQEGMFLAFGRGGLHSTDWFGILKEQIADLEFAAHPINPFGLIDTIDPFGLIDRKYVTPAVVVFAIMVVASVAAFLCIDVNTFSLQNLYRNRLVRCYLGAAHGPARLANPYAGFDPRDDFPLRKLSRQRPYLLVNAALNITQGPDLAWQQRKAAAFVFSPLWSGYWLGSAERSGTGPTQGGRGGYVRTVNYVREFPAFERDPEGILIGTAIATSGAAVSSQMGWASRGPLAFVLTLLNLRLGRWFPNPSPPGPGIIRRLKQFADAFDERAEWKSRERKWKATSPWFGGLWYLNELLGRTNERSSWVYVSDGGHFENLGIYELVRRRCTRILCVDAGADPERTFSDLGNAVQKCRVDFGVDITIDIRPLQTDATGMSETAYVAGTIEYPQTLDEPRCTGELLYLKPSLPRSWDDLPADILAYRSRHREFPHEATINQWFSESQFESYRQLGYVIAQRALADTGLIPQHNVEA